MDFQNQIISQLQGITQSNQTLNQQISEIQAHLKVVDNQLAQLANPPPQPLFPGNPNPNPINQAPPYTAKGIHLRSGMSYKEPEMPWEDEYISQEEGKKVSEKENESEKNEIDGEKEKIEEKNEKGDKNEIEEGEEKNEKSEQNEIEKK
ncbi:unnamed protein product [Amaranthus hypochondriacus]